MDRTISTKNREYSITDDIIMEKIIIPKIDVEVPKIEVEVPIIKVDIPKIEKIEEE